MMTMIIKMKEQEDLSVEDTTNRLNKEGHKTITGKDVWDVAMISKIYSYIEKVRARQKT